LFLSLNVINIYHGNENSNCTSGRLVQQHANFGSSSASYEFHANMAATEDHIESILNIRARFAHPPQPGQSYVIADFVTAQAKRFTQDHEWIELSDDGTTGRRSPPARPKRTP
ncbi:hypothetical protein LTR16_008782, partial [Cryomyces antarcticus]